MTPPELIAAVEAAGGWLVVEGETLRCRAPKGAVSPDLLAEVREQKAAVLAWLTRPVITEAERAAISAWTIDDQVAYLARLSPDDLATYRRALRFDLEALRRLDAHRGKETT